MTMRLTRRSFLATSAAGAALTFVGPKALRAATNGTLRFGLSAYPPSFDAWASSGSAAGTIKLMMHRGLLGFGPDGKMRGELAESFSVDDDGVWTFKLRDAKWHDGSPVTAEDIAWNVAEAAKPDSTAYFRGEFQSILKVEMPDDKTVRMITKEPSAVLPGWFAHFNMPMIKKGEAPDTTMGAGPFKLEKTDRGVSLSLVAFDGYYKEGLPKLAGIQAIVYADENLRVAALDAGDVDLIEYVPWQAMEQIEANDQLALDAVDGPFMYLTFNAEHPPFDDPKVRRAIAHAIKREDIVAAAFYGRGGPLEHLPLAEGSEYYNADLAHGWNYDPEKAKALLAEAGHPDGFECTMLATSQYGMHQSTAEVCQAYLSMVGINVRLDLPEWATRVQKGNQGQYDMAVMGTTASNNDPDGMTQLVDGSLPASFVRSYGLKTPKLTELLAKGRQTFDEAKRKAIYEEMEKQAIEETPIVGLAWRSQGFAMKKTVSGFTNMPGQLCFYSPETLEETALG